MCGIVGIITTRPLLQLNIYDFVNSLRHRGPDNWGYYISTLNRASFGGEIDSHLVQTGLDWTPKAGDEAQRNYQRYLHNPCIMMSHARLSILDLSSLGNQPMVYSDNNLVLVFNGEIYNYRHIRSCLEERGYEFRTESDSEVLLAAYKEWGEECVQHFNGMWAFAIYNRQKKRLFLSRDRLGVKPLFYTYNSQSGYWAFASEIKALIKLPGMKASANREKCRSYLLYGGDETDESTFFQNIIRLQPACNLVIDLDSIDNLLPSSICIKNYWNLPISNERITINEKEMDNKADEFYNLFADAVKLRLRADVRVGTALSGGLDSSSNVYVINQLLREGKADGIGLKQYSFSSVFERAEESYADESRYIDLITKQMDIKVVKVVPTPERLQDEAESLVFHQDEPFSSTSMFAQWCVFSLPRPQGVLVTLDGQGADEQLAGYLHYLGVYWANIPLYDLNLYREIWKTRDINGAWKQGLSQLLAGKTDYNLLSLLNSRLQMKRHISIADKILGDSAYPTVQLYMDRRAKTFNSRTPSLNERLAFDTRNGLPILLRYADRSSMAYGIESRDPYLDYRLAEYLASLPADYKVHNGWTKYIARRAFAGKLPDDITWRRDKMAFLAPEKTWLTGPLRKWGQEIVNESEFLRELGVRSDIFDNYDYLAQDNSLWKLINMQLWAKVFRVQ